MQALSFVSWALAAIGIAAGYSTGYSSRLTRPFYARPVDTVQQFIDQQLQFGFLYNHTEFLADLQESGFPEYNELSRRYIILDNSTRPNELLRSGGCGLYCKITSYGYLMEVKWARDVLKYLRKMRSCTFSYYHVIALPRNSPYLDFLNHHIQRYTRCLQLMSIYLGSPLCRHVECGHVKKSVTDIYLKYDGGFKKQLDSAQNAFGGRKSLNLTNMGSVFHLWGAGIILSFFVFIVEVLVDKMMKRDITGLLHFIFMHVFVHYVIYKKLLSRQ